MKLYHFKMHFTCIKSVSQVFYWEAEEALCHLQILVEANDKGPHSSGGASSLLLLKLPVSFPDSVTLKSNFPYEPT